MKKGDCNIYTHYRACSYTQWGVVRGHLILWLSPVIHGPKRD